MAFFVAFHQTAFTTQKDFGREAREAAWASEQRTLHGLRSVEPKMFLETATFRDINIMAEEAKRRAEIARLRELHTLKGKVESFAKLRGFDIDAMNQNYTRRKFVEQELEKMREKIPLHKKQSEAAKDAKMQVLKELESTKRLIQELKFNLDRGD
ncbi:unnamed protein product [Ilex paraguariensis]|uniref:Uncharacterized protein n=1 Tax=Ilex paraguariensis TaxID=185542 RepID=A0ABC8RMJ2_9AQUA